MAAMAGSRRTVPKARRGGRNGEERAFLGVSEGCGQVSFRKDEGGRMKDESDPFSLSLQPFGRRPSVRPRAGSGDHCGEHLRKGGKPLEIRDSGHDAEFLRRSFSEGSASEDPEKPAGNAVLPWGCVHQRSSPQWSPEPRPGPDRRSPVGLAQETFGPPGVKVVRP